MDVRIVSDDRDLYKLCREILAAIPGHRWTVSAVSPEEAGNSADLYLWDFQPRLTLQRTAEWSSSKHLFLVHRRDLPKFREDTGSAEAHILLKPANRATLTAFLGLAVAAHEERVTAASSLQEDRDELLQCLLQTNLKLQEYDQDRTSFLARAVHDFRAPLTALNGYCGLLLSEPLGPLNEPQREVLRRMQQSAQRLAKMSSSMFELSIERQVKRLPDLKKGDIRECVDQAVHEVTQAAEAKQLTITTDLRPHEYDLYFETGQIEQVLVNILENACKFTPRSGSIVIEGYPYFWDRRATRSGTQLPAERRRSAAQEPNSYRVDVQDSGAPMPEEHLKNIFEEYTSYAGVRDRSGGGLGLAICRMIVAQHEGVVWAQNSAAGPMFSFVLPLYRAEPARVSEQPAKAKVAEVG